MASTPCVGGGTMPAGPQPAVAPALARPDLHAGIAQAVTPLAWARITTTTGRAFAFAKATIPHGPTPALARVERFGTLTRRLTDRDGGPQASTVTTVLLDTDRQLRRLANEGVLQYALVEYFVADLATLVAGGASQRVFRGRVQNWQADARLTLTLTVEDDLTARLTSAEAQDAQSPLRMIDSTVSDQTPRASRFEKGAPEAYGSLNDGDDQSPPDGTFEAQHTTSITLAAAPGLGNMAMFLVSAQAVQRIQSIYAANTAVSPPVERGPLNPALIGVNVFVPGYPGWPLPNPWYESESGRWTVIFMQGHLVETQMAVDGRIPLAVSLCGYEHVGDTTGVIFDQPVRAFLHWFNNRMLQDVALANWQPLALLGDYALFDTASFDRVHAICDARGYRVAGVLAHDNAYRSWRDRVGEWCRNFGFEMGTNRHGQVMLNILDRTQAYASARAFTPAQILDDGVTVARRSDAIENIVPFSYRANYVKTIQKPNPTAGAVGLREPYDGPWRVPQDEVANEASITALGGHPRGERRAAVQEYSLVRDATTATRVAQERLALNALPNGRSESRFRVMLKDGWDVELGDIIALEHWDVPWDGRRRCQVRQIVFDLDTFTIELTARAVEDLLPALVTLEALMTGGIASPPTATEAITTEVGIPIMVNR